MDIFLNKTRLPKSWCCSNTKCLAKNNCLYANNYKDYKFKFCFNPEIKDCPYFLYSDKVNSINMTERQWLEYYDSHKNDKLDLEIKL